MVLATLEVGTAAEEEEFERSYQDQGLVKVWEQKKFQKPFPPASPHCERNRQDFKGRKLQRSEKFSSTRQLVRYCAATRILPALRRESISMLGVQLQLAATTSAPSSTWPL